MINESILYKNKIHKLNALHESLGNDIADNAFAGWMKMQTK
jgi:hypothetical protein